VYERRKTIPGKGGSFRGQKRANPPQKAKVSARDSPDLPETSPLALAPEPILGPGERQDPQKPSEGANFEDRHIL
jgi:hypothetical protein